ncbi:MAG: metallophosphoesterase [Deltaproteobacteria bacterium]|nr:metallophosphoesterase [Deltaproteobacteria bacterium]
MIHLRHLAALAVFTLALVGCNDSTGSTTTGTTIAGSGSTGHTSTSGTNGGSSGSNGGTVPGCGSCFDNSNCQSGYCVQLGHADSFCLDDCSVGCATGAHCFQLNDVSGTPQNVCTPDVGSCTDPASGACGSDCAGSYCDPTVGACVGATTGTNTNGTTGNSSTTATTSTSGTTGSTGSTGDCGIFAGPNTPETICHCSASNPADCQPNNCYGGYYCNTQSGACVSPTNACGSNNTSTTTGTTGTTSTSTTGSTGTSSTTGTTTTGTSGTSAGAPWSGSVNKNGGSVDRLYFAAVGDSRPPNEDDTSNYPTAIITKIYQDMQGLSVKPQFVVATGDYMYANPSGNAGATQMGYYLNAQANYTAGPVFPSMGNHECTGYTSSNCTGSAGNNSNNFQAFMSQMMSPLGQSKPYYRFDVNDTNGAWTAKFIVLAMNAWDSTQKSWLQTQLAQSTTYTFIIRHEPSDATTAPGIPDSETVINAAPYTLKIVGHTHEFYHQSGAREVIVGNGGAPLGNPSDNYGYAVIQMLADGNIQVDNMDYNSNSSVRSVLIPK